jgi:hypothetical protein
LTPHDRREPCLFYIHPGRPLTRRAHLGPYRESQEPAMTHFGREPVMATSSSEPSMAAVTRRREYGELVQEPVAPPG